MEKNIVNGEVAGDESVKSGRIGAYIYISLNVFSLHIEVK